MSWFTSSYASAFIGWLTDFYVWATVLLLIYAIACRWIGQPAKRQVLAWGVMLELLALAVLCATPFWPKISLVRATAPQTSEYSQPLLQPELYMNPRVELTPTIEERSISPSKDAEAPAAVPAPSVREPFTWAQIVAASFLGGSLFFCLWLCWGVLTTLRIRRRALPASSELHQELSQIVPGKRRVPGLLVSPRISNAVAMGVFNPAILLPEQLAESGPRHSLRAVLAHELAHIRNRDLWLLALGRCLLPVLYAHPFFWHLRQAIRHDQELLADAAAAGENRQVYAEELVLLVRMTADPRPLPASGTLAIWENSSQLSRRITTLLDETFYIDLSGPRKWKYRALVLLVLLGAACSLLTLKPAALAAEKAKSENKVAKTAENKNDEVFIAFATANESEKQDGKRPDKGSSSAARNSAAYTVSGAVTISSDEVNENYRLSFANPSLLLLGQKSVLKELNITLEQNKKLKEILKNFHNELSKRSRKLMLSEGKKQRQEAAEKAIEKWSTEQERGFPKKVEAILSPKQWQTLKQLTFYQDAAMLRHPRFSKKIDLTSEQTDKIKSLVKEMDKHGQKNNEKTSNEMLKVLTPDQRTKFRELVFGPLNPLADSLLSIDVGGKIGTIVAPSLAPYADFSDKKVQRQLRLNAEQQKQVREILGGKQNLTERLKEEWKKLPPKEQERYVSIPFWTATLFWSPTSIEEQKKKRQKQRADWEKQTLTKVGLALRRQFGALLTPNQLAAYKEVSVKNAPFHTLFDQLTQHEIGLSKRQQADIRRLFLENMENSWKFARQIGARMLKILSPAQQDKLREAIEQMYSGIESRMGNPSPPKDKQPKDNRVRGRVTISGNAANNTLTTTNNSGASKKFTHSGRGTLVLTSGVNGSHSGDKSKNNRKNTTVPFSLSGNITKPKTNSNAHFHLVRGGSTWIAAPGMDAPLIYDDYDKNFWMEWPEFSVVLSKSTDLFMPEDIDLPAYRLLRERFVRQKLNLSPEQIKKLQDISAAYWAERRKIAAKEMGGQESKADKIMADANVKSKTLAKKMKQPLLSEEESKKHALYIQAVQSISRGNMLVSMVSEGGIGSISSSQFSSIGSTGISNPFSKETLRKLEAQWKDARREIEKVLTPQQLKTLKDLSFQTYAYASGLMFEAKTLDKLNLTPRQKGKAYRLDAKLREELNSRLRHVTSDKIENMLAVLSDQQRKQLEEKLNSPKKVEPVYGMYPYPGLPYYDKKGAADALGLLDVQRKAINEILKKYWGNRIKIQQQMQKLSRDDADGLLAVQKKIDKLAPAVREQIEGIMTPEQLAAYKKMAYQNMAMPMLKGFMAASKPSKFAKKLEGILKPFMDDNGISAEQQAAMRRIEAESFEKPELIYREMTDKAMEAFTPAQQRKLRAEIDRRAW
ncbi:MAG: M56 family metallopeptidase [Thermoguttaceae bacterium]